MANEPTEIGNAWEPEVPPGDGAGAASFDPMDAVGPVAIGDITVTRMKQISIKVQTIYADLQVHINSKNNLFIYNYRNKFSFLFQKNN